MSTTVRLIPASLKSSTLEDRYENLGLLRTDTPNKKRPLKEAGVSVFVESIGLSQLAASLAMRSRFTRSSLFAAASQLMFFTNASRYGALLTPKSIT